MDSIKKFIDTIVKLWKNKRTRSAVIFGLYATFFIIMVVYVRINNTKNSEYVNENEVENKEIDNKNKELTYFNNYKYDTEIRRNNGEMYKISNNNEENVTKYYFFDTNSRIYGIVDALPNEILHLDFDYILYLINKADMISTKKIDERTTFNEYNIKLYNEDTKITVKHNSEMNIMTLEFLFNGDDYFITFSN